ncbi:hypothetical protein B9037_006280 [Klebsiella aerogenes]|nr:hypothetical protein B9037_006280 [Klebsiella aerogenes]
MTSLSTATRPWSTSATGTTLIIFSLYSPIKKSLPLQRGDIYVTCHLPSDKQNSHMGGRISEIN